MDKTFYIKPESAVVRLASGETVLQSSLLPVISEFDTPQIEDVEVVNYDW